MASSIDSIKERSKSPERKLIIAGSAFKEVKTSLKVAASARILRKSALEKKPFSIKELAKEIESLEINEKTTEALLNIFNPIKTQRHKSAVDSKLKRLKGKPSCGTSNGNSKRHQVMSKNRSEKREKRISTKRAAAPARKL